MRRFRLQLEYDGSDFAGWQAQDNAPRTVQGVLEMAAQPLGLVGRAVAAGRTDAGVHACGQVCHLDLTNSINVRRLSQALNSRLPLDVRVLQAEEVDFNFHARFSCLWRAYRYRLLLNSVDSALKRQRLLWIPQKLNIQMMKNEAKKLVGVHDFAAFASREERNTVRKMYFSHLQQVNNELHIWLIAESFLRHMVRAIVGTLIKVGYGQISDIEQVISSKKRALAGPNVPPHGLYFEKAGYEPLILPIDFNNLWSNH